MHFIGNIARKEAHPDLLRVEAAKSEQARLIGDETGLFYVPEIISFDEQAGVLDFERIADLRPINDLFETNDPRLGDLLETAGRSLAAVHARLKLDKEMTHALPPEWRGPDDGSVYFHGDLSGWNVCYLDDSSRLAIVDWSASPMLGRLPTFGTRYVDLTWFTWGMFVGLRWKSRKTWKSPIMAEAFLRGYVAESGRRLDDHLYDYYSEPIRRWYRKNALARTKRSAWFKRGAHFLFEWQRFREWQAFYLSSDYIDNRTGR